MTSSGARNVRAPIFHFPIQNFAIYAGYSTEGIMGRLAPVTLLLLLTACSSIGAGTVVEGPPESATSPVRIIINSSGEGDAQAVYVPLGADPNNPAHRLPITALFRWSHNVTIVGQPYPPYIIYSGDSDIVVEPVPGQEQRAQEALDRGFVQIRRAGIVGHMNAPGSIATMRARTAGVPAPAEFPDPPPEAAEDDWGTPPATDKNPR